jgi:hypothetical protein
LGHHVPISIEVLSWKKFISWLKWQPSLDFLLETIKTDSKRGHLPTQLIYEDKKAVEGSYCRNASDSSAEERLWQL